MAASIVKENANIALKLLENSNCFSTRNTSEPANNNCDTKRRSYKDFLSETDLSTEGALSFSFWD